MVSRSNHSWLICLLLVAVTFAVFFPLLNAQFIHYDDPLYVRDNPAVKTGLTAVNVAWAFRTGHAGNWHPLTWLSHMLDVELFGMKPERHHLTSLLLHISNTLLLFFIFRKMTKDVWCAGLVAALFAWHPMHVQSVAWISERKDVLSTFFGLLSIFLYVRWVETAGEKAGKRASSHFPTFYFLSLLFFALSLMSKPMLVTLPFVLLLLDHWPLARAVSWKERIVEKIPFFILSAASSTITFLVQNKSGAVSSIETLSLPARAANALDGYLRYIEKSIWPVHLSIFYPLQKTSAWQAGLAFILLAALSYAIWRFGRSRRYLIIGWLWFVGMLVPVIGLVQVGEQAMADRYTYLPFIGLFIMMAWGLRDLCRERNLPVLMLHISSAAILIVLLCITRVEAGHWRNSGLLFQQALAVTSSNYLAHVGLGNFLMDEGKTKEAREHYEKALAIRPTDAEASYNLANFLAQEQKFTEAIARYKTTLSYRPTSVVAHYNLANALFLTEQFLEASNHYAQCLALEPSLADAHFRFGNTLLKLGKMKKALSHYGEAIRLQPAFQNSLEEAAAALLQQGKSVEAGELFAEIVRRKPSDAKAHYRRAITLVLQGRSSEALTFFKTASELLPGWAAPLNDRAWILATDPDPRIRNGVEAVQLSEQACRLVQTRDARYLSTLDAAYAEAGRFADALQAVENTLQSGTAANNTEVINAAQHRKALYRSGRPFHGDQR